jgi:hypothetical protein
VVSYGVEKNSLKDKGKTIAHATKLLKRYSVTSVMSRFAAQAVKQGKPVWRQQPPNQFDTNSVTR